MDLDPIIRTGTRAAYRAGRILNEHFGKATRITKKGLIDLVTEADTAAEDVIIETIRQEYPHHVIQAEESGLHAGEDAGRWIIDPLDGTTNFAHGLNLFCVSIAFATPERVVAGIVLIPSSGELYTATRGGGAMLNQHAIQVSATASVQDSLLATGFPYDIRNKTAPVLSRLQRILTASQGVRRLGAAALDLCYVACGRVEGFWEEDLKPWDLAAGALIVEEAGGRVTDYRGLPVNPSRGEILASNGLIHDHMLSLLLPEEER